MTGEADRLRRRHAELGDILDELERDDLDVDVLAAACSGRASSSQLCRGRIARAQADVERIVTDLESFGASEPDDG